MKLDGIRGGDASYPGKPSCTGIESCHRYHKTEPIRRSRSGKGAEGGRSTGSTDETGPMKPGNSVEDKTLRTGKGKVRESLWAENPPLATVNTHLSRRHDWPENPGPGVPIASLGDGRPWTRGDDDHDGESK